MDEQARLKKNEQIRETRKKTKEKRETQELFVRELKIDIDKCNQETLRYFDEIMIESKWIKNNALSQKSVKDMVYGLNEVPVRYMKDGQLVEEVRKLKTLSKQVQNRCIDEIKANIKTLATKKNKGMKIGGIRFIKEVDSITYHQETFTHQFRYNDSGILTHVKLSKNKQWIKVRGGKQLVGIDEIACIRLVKKPSGYYIHVTCCIDKSKFQEWKESFSKTKVIKKDAVAVDFGIKTTASYSDNSEQQERGRFDIKINESGRLKTIQRKLSKLLIKIKQTGEYKSDNRYRSKNYIRLIKLLRIEHEKIVNKRLSKAKQFIGFLSKRYNMIVFQDEQITGWYKGLFGKQVQHSALGTCKSELKRLVLNNSAIMLDKWQPTTKQCPICSKINKLSLSDRWYSCECGFEDDRDFKSADTMLIMVGYKIPRYRLITVTN